MTTALPVQRANRRLDLNGTYNFRDVGGYATRDGLSTKWNKLFRADALHRLDQADREILRARGLAFVIDLREQEELDTAPNALGGLDLQQLHLPIFESEMNSRETSLDLAAIYAKVIDQCGVRLVRAVRAIAESDDSAVLVHCTAGKDRTGLVVALALAAVGVDYRDIVADYSLSEVMLAGEWATAMAVRMREYGIGDGENLAQLVGASPAALMRASLQTIDDSYGSASDYLLAHGMSSEELDRLHLALVN
ncbi:tyrosine-protein phosphatase [Rhodococcus sp. SG20037]|uniref:tyrosine-protein phosphatase n=1 Tax=Rhodococcus sp. SG20037 TaxID=3074148 RepID=UPI00287F3FC6|nr:tyrosine-protein phosphatase [Rhodococcus sp. SG20037]WNF41559.1 tyrosine-protein phosphatase [Rhodococcus sp. SG20037]